ncbi:hypothetical protein [Streptomyces sp. MI02-7b]|uniref:hypothetical protein n=1 Tax=Streptomyces sp. MI02-7b TaxID=462941 RepID=UPI0029BC36F8|nr:hypothetical protein [Streptomyces sp. MI02-7b]MDX3072670.1 hypothetical protein [Streptomyces sp. MI02-7b]
MNPVLHGLAVNPLLPSGLIDRMVAGADDDLAEALVCRPDLSRAQVRALAARFEGAGIRLAHEGRLTADDIDPAAQPRAALALLEEGRGRQEWARMLAADPGAQYREKLAACPDLPPDVVAALAEDPDVQVAAELALWTTVPEDAARLAAHPHADVRCSVAANEATPPGVLESLLTGSGLPPARSCRVCDREPIPFVHDPNCARPHCELPPGAACDGSHESTLHEIRQKALDNPATPPAAAARFAGHPSVLLRQALAARTDLPHEVYARLAEDPVPWVRERLADNPAIGEPLIRSLADDRGHDVRRRLAHHPRLPLDVLDHLTRVARIGPTRLPRVEAASRAEVDEMAASRNPVVRMLVAERRDLPDAVRDALAGDPDAKVVKSVAPHPGLSEAGLRAMIGRHGVRVVAKVATNPGATPALLEELTRHRPPVPKALRAIARHPAAPAAALLACLSDRQARPIAAGHPGLPPSAITELLGDDDGQVVRQAAANPSLPTDVMAQLVP